jgi:RNA polymerase primary sigma factor
MTNNLQNPDLQTRNTTGEGILGEGAEKYIRDVANIEDLPGDDDDLVIDDDEDDDIETVDLDEDVDDVETEQANDDVVIDDEEDEDYINKDEAERDLRERGLRP